MTLAGCGPPVAPRTIVSRSDRPPLAGIALEKLTVSPEMTRMVARAWALDRTGWGAGAALASAAAVASKNIAHA
jgi:hypothetical protein